MLKNLPVAMPICPLMSKPEERRVIDASGAVSHDGYNHCVQEKCALWAVTGPKQGACTMSLSAMFLSQMPPMLSAIANFTQRSYLSITYLIKQFYQYALDKDAFHAGYREYTRLLSVEEANNGVKATKEN